ncbi:hypothetical protein KIW84_020584 [Lathyrus oleraceus]|uniref:RIN4 pathogenic type III effector avirulence factor Avr cleavage site domain-containing protein n=1 Tax=Pisum sativum TaxID=3888 RepID=A0A9D5B2T0_PEA|nr:hypothetical protein KIW84_020584 [Pisum sativum]
MILCMQKNSAKTSVPQFGGWDQKSIGATDYSMVFTQARANKKQQKTDLTEVKRGSTGNELDLSKTNQGHAHPAQGHHAHHARDLAKANHGQTHPPRGRHAQPAHAHPVHTQPAHAIPHAEVCTPSQEDSVVMKNSAKTSVPQFGGWDQKSIGATDYSMVFTQARANKKQQKTDLTEVKRGSIGNELDLSKTNQGHAHPAQGHHAHHARDLAKANHGQTHPPRGRHAQPAHAHPVHAQPAHAIPHAEVCTPSQEDSVVMVRLFSLAAI